MSMMFLWNTNSIEFHSDFSHVREKERVAETEHGRACLILFRWVKTVLESVLAKVKME